MSHSPSEALTSKEQALRDLLARLREDGGRYLLSVGLTREERAAAEAPTYGGKPNKRWLTDDEYAALCALRLPDEPSAPLSADAIRRLTGWAMWSSPQEPDAERRADVREMLAELDRLRTRVAVAETEAHAARHAEPPFVNSERAFEIGWRTAAHWANRDDLIADIGSPAYIDDRVNALGLAPPPADDRDGERYRWLRSHIAPSILSRLIGTPRDLIADQRPEALDKWLDTRLSETKSEGAS